MRRQLQAESRNIQVLGFGASYIRDFVVIRKSRDYIYGIWQYTPGQKFIRFSASCSICRKWFLFYFCFLILFYFYLFIYSFIYLFIYSFIHLFIYSFIFLGVEFETKPDYFSLNLCYIAYLDLVYTVLEMSRSAVLESLMNNMLISRFDPLHPVAPFTNMV